MDSDQDRQAAPEHNDAPSLGQRMLAAIMFTDVVGFSRLVGQDEERTLRFVRRDLAVVSSLCERFNGRVMKELGDGCLALFTSGVQAVECAQEIQRHFAEQAQTSPKEDCLRHRIGVHLGDVYLTDDEVMGDGVNIAARLQGQALPGGICISQALYEVVRTRLSLQTVYVGAKQLKNIQEPVQVHQILIGRHARWRRLLLLPMGRLTGTAFRWAVTAACALLLLALAVQAPKRLFRSRSGGGEAGSTTPGTDGKPSASSVLEQYDQLKTQALRKRDYAAVVAWMGERGLDSGALADEYAKYRKLEALFDWAEARAALHDRDHPLRMDGSRTAEVRLWCDPDGSMVATAAAGKPRPVSLRTATQPAFVLSVLVALVRDATRTGGEGVDRGTIGKVVEGIQIFMADNNIRGESLLSGYKKLQGERSGSGGKRPARDSGDWRRGGGRQLLGARTRFPQAREQHLRERDYAGLVAWMKQNGLDRAPGMREQIQTYTRLAGLMAWVEERLKAHGRDSPFVLRGKGPGGVRLWSQPDGELVFEGPGGGGTASSIRKMGAAQLAHVMRELIRSDKGLSDSQRRQRVSDLELFARENGVAVPSAATADRRGGKARRK